MSTHTRAKTKRQWRHPASRSRSHLNDKRQGEARRETQWVPVAAPEHPRPDRSFAPLQAHEYTYDGSTWRRCNDPEEFADYLETEARRRNWFMDRTQRKGVPVQMRRPAETPVEVLTTTFSPWLADWTEAQLKAERDPRQQLAAIRNQWLRAALGLLAGQRFVLGLATHVDSKAAPHIDLCLSRQSGTGERVGKAGLSLVGPWCVGCSRQKEVGAQIHPEKQRQLTRSVANFRGRYGEDAVPLDVSLARALDTAADEVLGAELQPYRAAYAKRVPEMERQHAAAQLAVLKVAEEKLQERAAPEPERERPQLNLPTLSRG
jgi:hypothetical protein